MIFGLQPTFMKSETFKFEIGTFFPSACLKEWDVPKENFLLQKSHFFVKKSENFKLR